MTATDRESGGGVGDQDALVDALVQFSYRTMGVLSRLAAENDLSLTQLRVLGILRDRRLRITAIADYLGLEKSTLSGLVDRAEKRGLVERAPSATDRRAVDVLLTASGHDLSSRLTAELRTELTPYTSTLAADEQQQVRSLLERMLGGDAL
ncbi:MarR family transcriptional regulator [Leifsonia sp. PS1209]|uniref:MarR family winged helix-turn-helix transcriptional regulator n=1 Tax=Leifsonia sp. PS1209 TaxID=2724914 RepID=UPI001442BF9C|nr:MarR family transcriptional regulator [Leifsonia sp. PS1209]QIZ98764.1 MarR family transcriptional regulator [Leifsonia sp. PS1209]